MEMEMMAVQEEGLGTGLGSLIERLVAAAGVLEQAAERLNGREVNIEARAATREAELEQRLAEANATIASLKAGRKTLPAGVATLLAKDGSAVELSGLDAALTSLSLEQRIAVKAQLLRSGLIG
jgi:hypothetical protein